MLIIHGSHETASRNFLNKFIDRSKSLRKSVIRFDAEQVDLTDLTQKLESTGLFQEDQLFVLFGLFSLPSSDFKKRLVDYLKSKQDSDLVIYESDTIPSPSLRPFTKAKIEVFKTSPQVFALMDQLLPGNSAVLLKLYDQAIASGDAPEFIFAMVIRHVRLLIAAASNPSSQSLPVWQKQKLQKQAHLFGLPRLHDIHRHLYEIDKSIKTGVSPLEYRDQIFILFLNT